METSNYDKYKIIKPEPPTSDLNNSYEQMQSNPINQLLVPGFDLSKELKFNISKQKLIRNKLCGQIISSYPASDSEIDNPIKLIHSTKSSESKEDYQFSRKSYLKQNKIATKNEKKGSFHRKPCDKKNSRNRSDLVKESETSCACLLM